MNCMRANYVAVSNAHGFSCNRTISDSGIRTGVACLTRYCRGPKIQVALIAHHTPSPNDNSWTTVSELNVKCRQPLTSQTEERCSQSIAPRHIKEGTNSQDAGFCHNLCLQVYEPPAV
jgi:hypothetical protein